MLNTLTAGISYLCDDGQYFILFLLSLVVIFYFARKDYSKYLYLIVGLTALIICPLTALLLGKYQTNFYQIGHIGVMLPLSITIALGLVLVFEYITDKYKDSKHKLVIYVSSVIAAILLVILSGGVSILPKAASQSGSSSDIDETVVVDNVLYKSYSVIDETLSLLPIEEDITILSNDEVLERARIFEGQDIKLVYGRNMWEAEAMGQTYDQYSSSLKALHSWINDTRSSELIADANDQMLSLILTTDTDYCIFTAYRLYVGNLAESLDAHPGYTLYAQNDSYSIYAINKEYNQMPDNGWVASSYSDVSGNQALFYTLYNNNDGTLIVIDGGWSENADYVRKVIKSLGGHVTAWYITHYHNDHVNAFNEIYANPQGITIDAVYSPDYKLEDYKAVAKEWDNVDSLERFLEITNGADNVYHPVREDVLTYNGLTITVLNTYDEFLLESGSEDLPNDTSLMLRIDGSMKSMLIVGDCRSDEFSAQFLSKYSDKIDVDYMQAGHHGNHSLCNEFYDLASPEVVIFDAPIKITESDSYSAVILKEYLTQKGASVVDYQTAPNHFSLD